MTGPDLIRLAEELARCGGVHRLTSLVTAALHVHREQECARIERLETCLRAILAADERGQGLPFAEAMDEAARLVWWHRNPRARMVETWEDGPEVGVGMSDKVARDWDPLSASTPPCARHPGPCSAGCEHGIAGPCLRDAARRAPEREGECGGPGGSGTDRGALAGFQAPLVTCPLCRATATAFVCSAAGCPVNGGMAHPEPGLCNPAPLTSINGERKPLPMTGGIIHEPGSKIAAEFGAAGPSQKAEATQCDSRSEAPISAPPDPMAASIQRAQSDFGRLVPRYRPTNPEDLGDGA